MKVKMKAYEKKCIDYTARYKQWEVICSAKDCFLEGYRLALKDCEDHYFANVVDSYPTTGGDIMDEYFTLSNVGQELVEVEFPDGSHQLTRDSITKP